RSRPAGRHPRVAGAVMSDDETRNGTFVGEPAAQDTPSKAAHGTAAVSTRADTLAKADGVPAADTSPVSENAAVRANSTSTRPQILAGLAVVLILGALTRYLELHVPDWAADTPFKRIAKSIEYPIYAIALGLLGAVVLTKLGLRDK